MPKIVDHEKYRMELAGRALNIFAKYGYSGLGMRQIADELGISKSALYHYFPTKEALFAVCTELATSFESNTGDEDVALKEASPRERLQALAGTFQSQETNFPGELSLLVDYLRGNTPKDTANDKNMKLANQRYHKLVSDYMGEEDANPILCMMLGTLLQRFFDGQSLDWNEILDWLGKRLGEVEYKRHN